MTPDVRKKAKKAARHTRRMVLRKVHRRLLTTGHQNQDAHAQKGCESYYYYYSRHSGN